MSVPVTGGALRRRPHPIGFAISALLALGACTPTFNWRELRPEGTPLQALMPCKPESAARAVSFDGAAPVELHMHSCDTGGLTFAVAWADMGDAVRAPAALDGWRRASLGAVRVDPDQADDPATRWNATVRGAPVASGLTAQGRDHSDQPVQMRAVHFSSGSQVYQAAVYGPALAEEVTAAFFDGLRLP
ncbi:MAG: hypothetical protein K5880_12930 [Hydrogenophaga sp.]|uniref:hypothetical protein n=1 Tax=Hydrogenophaga sp. TaxID=1904254 RepID=UPI002604C319|nr:hypothetical protein [Hydrogenophaga sp.]MCV0439529.1 hypothetical protein [Hydrogenophaga sp.]